MKTFNRVLALVLCTIMFMLTVGCQQKDNTSLLPFSLAFGDSYKKIKDAAYVGDLEDSNANDGYISNLKYLVEEEEIKEILGTYDGVSDVAVGFAFNADKQLYEFYCFFTIENNKTTEIHNTIKQKYNELAGETDEVTDGIALWKNEEYAIDYRCTDPLKELAGEDANYVISIHSYAFDFE